MHELREGLSSAGVADPSTLSQALQTLELECALDLSELDGEEHAEMMGSLEAASVLLEARSKLRRMISSELHILSWSPASLIQYSILRTGNGEEMPRQLEKESKAGADGVSMDTIAVLITAALGLGSFFVQARAAKAADITQREVERAQTMHMKDRDYAAISLERARESMGCAYMPMMVELEAAQTHADHPGGWRSTCQLRRR